MKSLYLDILTGNVPEQFFGFMLNDTSLETYHTAEQYLRMLPETPKFKNGAGHGERLYRSYCRH